MAERRITKDRLIGDVLKEYPDTIRVFRKYFGKSCFDCPGQNHEDIEFGSVMHNADMDVVLDELNEIADKGRRR
ncbi:MAG TPA: DUF1858 domain-containing protein [Thermodesulfobacteriota bacterium]|nr:DUF1858 domain-containing protein [Thermodesulfobacteriota bacterium]